MSTHDYGCQDAICVQANIENNDWVLRHISHNRGHTVLFHTTQYTKLNPTVDTIYGRQFVLFIGSSRVPHSVCLAAL